MTTLYFPPTTAGNLTAGDVMASVTTAMQSGGEASSVTVQIEQSLSVDVLAPDGVTADALMQGPLLEAFCPGNTAACTVLYESATRRRQRALSTAGMSFNVTRTLTASDSLAAPAVDSGVLAASLGHNASAFGVTSSLLGNQAQVVAVQLESSSATTALLNVALALPATLAVALSLPAGAIEVTAVPQAMLPPAPPPVLSPPPPVPPSPQVAPSPTPAASPSSSPVVSSSSSPTPPSMSPIVASTGSNLVAGTDEGQSEASPTGIIVAVAVVGILMLVIATVLLVVRSRRAKSSSNLKGGRAAADVFWELSSPAKDKVDIQTCTPAQAETCSEGGARLESSPESVASTSSMSAAGQTALQRAREASRKSKGKSGEGSPCCPTIKRTGSWGRVAMRRPKSFTKQSGPDALDALETPLTDEGKTKMPPPAYALPYDESASADTALSPEMVDVVAPNDSSPTKDVSLPASPPENRKLSPPGSSASSRGETPAPMEIEFASAPTSDAPAADGGLMARVDALRERLDASLPSGLAFFGGSRSSGQLPTHASISESTTPRIAVAEETGELMEVQEPQRLPGMATAPPPEPHAPVPLGQTPPPPPPRGTSKADLLPKVEVQEPPRLPGMTTAPPPERQGATPSKPKRVIPMLVDGKAPTLSTAPSRGNLSLPRRNLEAANNPSAPASRSGISTTSLSVDRV